MSKLILDIAFSLSLTDFNNFNIIQYIWWNKNQDLFGFTDVDTSLLLQWAYEIICFGLLKKLKSA